LRVLKSKGEGKTGIVQVAGTTASTFGRRFYPSQRGEDSWDSREKKKKNKVKWRGRKEKRKRNRRGCGRRAGEGGIVRSKDGGEVLKEKTMIRGGCQIPANSVGGTLVPTLLSELGTPKIEGENSSRGGKCPQKRKSLQGTVGKREGTLAPT